MEICNNENTKKKDHVVLTIGHYGGSGITFIGGSEIYHGKRRR